MVRLYSKDDLSIIEDIHKKFFADDFDAQDLFDKHSLERVVVTDHNDEIITVGSLRTLVEVVTVTDMDRTVKERVNALKELLQAVQFITKTYGYDSLHCFPYNNKDWYNQLVSYGFAETKGKCLSIGVEHG